MLKYEEKRKERLKEDKPAVQNEGEEGADKEVHRSTTIFHGVNTDYGGEGRSGKGFVEPPSYLR